MLLHLLGNEFSQQEIETNYHYYEKRTLHGSSLSPSIYAIMGLKVGDDSKAYRYLRRAAMLDLLNLQHNTREGIHAANAGGVWQTVVFGFAGVNMDDDGVLSITPHMPHEWSSLTFRLHNRERGSRFVSMRPWCSMWRCLTDRRHLRINGETVTVPGARTVS